MGGFETGVLALWIAAAPGEPSTRLVLETIGPEWLGREKMESTITSELAATLGPLVPRGDFDIKKRKMKLRGKKAKKARHLARAAKSAGGSWLLLVQLGKRRGDLPFAATVKLIDAATGELALRFTEGYGRGGADEAARAIAARAIEYLGVSKPEPEPEPEAEGVPEAEPGPELVEAPPPPPAPEEESRDHHPGWVTAGGADPETPAEPVEETRTKGPVVEPAEPIQGRIEVTPEPPVEAAPSLGRVRLGAGSGWLRSIEVTGATIDDSALSYRLGPTSLFELGGEVVIPDVGLGAAIDLGVRPVRYSIATGSGDSSDPRGTIFDMFAVLLYRLTFGSESGLALIPQLGARLSIASVEEHPRDIIPAATTLAVIGGVALRLPIGELLEIEVGGHGGYVPLYSERPTDTGRSTGGITAGGHVALRVWLFAGLGIAFENRAGFDRLSFEEKPSRALPPEEQALEDASIGLFELKSTLAVAYRF